MNCIPEMDQNTGYVQNYEKKPAVRLKGYKMSYNKERENLNFDDGVFNSNNNHNQSQNRQLETPTNTSKKNPSRGLYKQNDKYA